MNKINFQKLGNWALDLVKGNSGTIIGGLSMIGMALICRKLDIPYQVITDPYFTRAGGNSKKTQTQPTVYLMPNDPVEASIAAIYNASTSKSSDYHKNESAKEIFSILVSRKDDLSDSNLAYGISLLQSVAQDMETDYYKNQVTRMIAKIGKGEF